MSTASTEEKAAEPKGHDLPDEMALAPFLSPRIIIIIITVNLQYSNKREALTTVNAIHTIKNKTI